MPHRIRVPAVMVAVVLALAAVLSACGSRSAQATSAGRTSASHSASADPSAARSSTAKASPPPLGGLPDIAVVRLGATFDPDTLHLGVGQEFVVIVSKGFKVSGSGLADSCTPAAAARFSSAMLSLRCTGSSFEYTARRAGSAVLSATVQPGCTAGSACPAWIAHATLKLAVTG